MRKACLFILILSATQQLANAQEFLLQAWHWEYPRFSDGLRWAERLEVQSEMIHDAGFTYVWLPPMSRAAAGSASVGYDVKDYYDLGELYGGGPTRLGKRQQVDDLITRFDDLGIEVLADMVFNHRSGGDLEPNPAVEGWIENMNWQKIEDGDNPFPSDRWMCYLPLGDTSGNEGGTYYFKVKSASQHDRFDDLPYSVLMHTNRRYINTSLDTWYESEPNGGGDCGEGNNLIELGRRTEAAIDAFGCGVDEFQLVIDTAAYHAAGDTLWIFLRNTDSTRGLGAFSDHYISGIWNGTEDIQDRLIYQTATDYSNMPSGMGSMNYLNFKPNGNPTSLNGDLDLMYWFYDVDHTVESTRQELFDWTKWMWDDAGVRAFRVDAVKHFQAEFMGDLMDYLHDNNIDPGLVVGESFDGNPNVLKGWVDEVTAAMDADTRDHIDMRVFDFTLRFGLERACDAFGHDVRNIFGESMVDAVGISRDNVVTFVDNHDFREEFDRINSNPELAYAYILTNPQLGLPTVFYNHFYGDENIRGEIESLIEVHKRYIHGAQWYDYLNRFNSGYSTNISSGLDHTTLIFQQGSTNSGREVIIAINFAGDPLIVDQQINATNISTGDTLTDIFGRSSAVYAIVDANNSVRLEVPARSFNIWVQGDLIDEQITIQQYNDTFVAPVEPTSVEENPFQVEQQILVFPNPTGSEFVVSIPTGLGEEMKIELHSIAGQQVFSHVFGGTNSAQSLSLRFPQNQPEGYYLLKLSSEMHQSTHKLLKWAE